MLKDTGYQEKIAMLKQWLPSIVEIVKKDLKNEHIKIDRAFARKYFLGKASNQLTTEEMAGAYEKDISEGNVGLAEFIATRWLIKNSDVYGFFEEQLKRISPDFEEIEEIDVEQSRCFVKESVSQFGWMRTYIFAVFNSVVFPQEIYEELRREAKQETDRRQQDHAETHEVESLEKMQKRYLRENKSAADRYEKKLNGLQKKYLKDMESMKKQIHSLQKRLLSQAVDSE